MIMVVILGANPKLAFFVKGVYLICVFTWYHSIFLN